jgi:hypothetical protein
MISHSSSHDRHIRMGVGGNFAKALYWLCFSSALAGSLIGHQTYGLASKTINITIVS